MTSNNLLTAVLMIAILGWIIYRQNQWRPFDPARMWRGPLVLGIVGVVVLASADNAPAVHTVDIVVLVFEAVLGLAVGALMGVLSKFVRQDGQLLVRTGAFASALWVALIAVRIGIDVVAVDIGAKAVLSVGAIIVLLAVSRLGRMLVISARAERLTGSRPMVRAH
ncbi:hypothetical protein ACIBCN_30005 [Nocardia sp. NPDC051052]|uniref:hypothetical protein n=1 Tax=Nocardia sp. NPDC051052 TaxID=3364322 RepID=UPI0037A4B600